MNNVRTVSDTKRAFYGAHTRPINAIYRRVVEELMVEMHLLLVNANFSYDSIYALGVVSVYDRFMAGYEPESDKHSIYDAVIKAIQGDPAQYRQDAEEVLAAAKSIPSVEAFKSLLEEAKTGGGDALKGNLNKVITNSKFKYSRLFATGLYNVIEAIDADVLADKEKREALLKELSATLGFNEELLLKDIELYRGNLEKMAQAQEVMKDMIEAEKKKQAKREQDKKDRDAAKAKAAEAKEAEAAAETDTPESSNTPAE
ncbi:MAG: photosystem II biogenesis protein Psp29 [Cyanobacteria bacterium P01_A01_bin.116]